MFRCFLSSRLTSDTSFEWSPKPRGVVPTVTFEMNPQDSLRSLDSTLPLRAHSDRFIPFSRGIWLSRDSSKLPESACRRWLSSRNRFQLSRWKAVGNRVRNSWTAKTDSVVFDLQFVFTTRADDFYLHFNKRYAEIVSKVQFSKQTLDSWSNLFMDSWTVIILILNLISHG